MAGQAPLTIETLQPEMIGDVFALRKELFTEETIASGVPPRNAEAHTVSWGDAVSLDRVTRAWTERIDNPDEHYLRAVYRGPEPVGLFIGALVDDDYRGEKYLDIMQLHPSIRGQGIGRLLMEGFADQGDPSRATYLHVFSESHGAQAFYSRLGFSDTNERKPSYIGGFRVFSKLLFREGRKA